MRLSLPSEAKTFKVKLDFIFALLWPIGLLVFMYGGTFIGVATIAEKAVVAVVMLIGGTVGCLLFRCIMFDFHLDRREFGSIMMWTLVSVGAIFMMNMTVKAQFEVYPMTERTFVTSIGIAEEMFFRVYLTAWLISFTKNPIFGIFLSSTAFTVYHLNVYGASLPNLAIVFGCGFILGYALWQTRRASPVMLAHGLTNFLSVR